MRIGICGMGYVGKALERFFRRSLENTLCTYDKFIPGIDTQWHRDELNKTEVAFVAVPTPSGSDGSCSTEQVEESVGWITCPICIKSTIIPGTVDRLTALTGKAMVFSPEYIGESKAHPWTEVDSCGFLIIGGNEGVTELVLRAYSGSARAPLQFQKTSARAAELCKYMENSFLATKVAFVNQFFDIASALDVDFNELRRLWLSDRRIGESHSDVAIERGFAGRCLPKDLLALTTCMSVRGGAPLLEAVYAYNRLLVGRDTPLEPAGET